MTMKEAVLLLLLIPCIVFLTVGAMLIRPGLLCIAAGFACGAAIVHHGIRE